MSAHPWILEQSLKRGLIPYAASIDNPFPAKPEPIGAVELNARIKAKEPVGFAFPSLEAYRLFCADTLDKRGASVCQEAQAQHTANRSWSPLSPSGALELARKGWDGGIPKQAPKVDSSLSWEAPALVYDVAGGAVDVGCYMSGEPECMVDMQPVADKRAVRILISSFVSCAVSTEQIERRASAIAGLCKGLIRAEVPFTVDVLNMGYFGACDNVPAIFAVPVYRSGWDVLTESQLAFWLGHPCAVRTLGFCPCRSLIEHETDGGSTQRGGKMEDALKCQCEASGDLLIPSVLSRNASEAEEKIEAFIKRFNEATS